MTPLPDEGKGSLAKQLSTWALGQTVWVPILDLALTSTVTLRKYNSLTLGSLSFITG